MWIALFIALIAAPSLTAAVDAEFKGNCDNQGILQRSDGGAFSTVVSINEWSDWTKMLTRTLTGVTKDTVIRVICKDVGVVGGFVGQISLRGQKYYTKKSLDDTPWNVISGAKTALVYTNVGSGAWGSRGPVGLDPNADWVWDSTTWNTLTFEFKFKSILADAVFKGNCDNRGTLLRSDNNGASFSEQLAGENDWSSWQKTLTRTLKDVGATTVLRVKCRDVGVVGGFIGQVSVNQDTYVTTNPVSNGKWQVNTGGLTYTANGQGAWGGYASAVDASAYWIWDGQTWNTLNFDFKFSSVLQTAAPSVVSHPVNEEPQSPQYQPVVGNGDAGADAVVGSSLYYLMMLTCGLLLINIALVTYARCRSCTIGAPKYSKVDLYSDGEVVGMNNNIEA